LEIGAVMKTLDVEFVENGAVISYRKEIKKDKDGNEIYEAPQRKVVVGNNAAVLQEIADIIK